MRKGVAIQMMIALILAFFSVGVLVVFFGGRVPEMTRGTYCATIQLFGSVPEFCYESTCESQKVTVDTKDETQIHRIVAAHAIRCYQEQTGCETGNDTLCYYLRVPAGSVITEEKLTEVMMEDPGGCAVLHNNRVNINGTFAAVECGLRDSIVFGSDTGRVEGQLVLVLFDSKANRVIIR